MPPLLLLGLAIKGGEIGSGVAKLVYVWYLGMSMVLFVAQFSLAEFADQLETQGWTFQIYGTGFLLGMLSVHFISNFVFITIVFPNQRLEDWGHIREYMAAQVVIEKAGMLGGLLLLGHIGILVANWHLDYVGDLVLANMLLLLLAQSFYGSHHLASLSDES